MKTIFITTILLLTTSALLSQVLETNPENIIIEYRNGKKTTRNKNDYKDNNPDSFHLYYRDDFEKKYLVKSDSAYICTHITGKWKFLNAVRTNNEVVKFNEPQYYFFSSDHSFFLIDGTDTSYGKWNYSNQSKGVIKVDYQKPKPVRIPVEIKKHIAPEYLRQMENAMSQMFTLNDVNNDTLIFFTVIPTEQKNWGDELYLRVVKMIYSKIE